MQCGSKLLDGTWSQSGEGFDVDLHCDSGRSLFELFRHDGTGDKTDSVAATPKMNVAGDQCGTKYYTPFGSGVSLGDLTHSQLATKSSSNFEPSEGRNGVIGKPLQPATTTNEINADKFSTFAKLSDSGTRATREQVEEYSTAMLLGFQFEQQKSNKSTNDKVSVSMQPRYSHQSEVVGHQDVHSYNAGKPQIPNVVPIARDGSSRCIAVEQQDKQLVATQQMFMQELNRLPPDLRKQYVDYMIASHLGMLPTPCQTVPTVPGMYYNVAVGPSAVPVTPMFGPPVIMPLMPTPVVTFRPVAPSSVTKSAIR